MRSNKKAPQKTKKKKISVFNSNTVLPHDLEKIKKSLMKGKRVYTDAHDV